MDITLIQLSRLLSPISQSIIYFSIYYLSLNLLSISKSIIYLSIYYLSLNLLSNSQSSIGVTQEMSLILPRQQTAKIKSILASQFWEMELTNFKLTGNQNCQTLKKGKLFDTLPIVIKVCEVDIYKLAKLI